MKRVQPIAKVLSSFPGRPGHRTAALTLAATGRTLREAESTWLQIVLSSATFAPRGLYGGKLVASQQALTFTLNRYSAVSGVQVSGKVSFVPGELPLSYKGTVRISGSAAVRGTLTFSKDSVSGRLGGRPIKGSY